MRIYTHEDIDVKIIVDNALSNITSHLKETFGNSYDTSTYDAIKEQVAQTDSKILQGLLYNFIGGMHAGQTISIKAGEANSSISLLMVNDFFAGGSWWFSFIRGLFKTGDKVEEGAGLADKGKRDQDNSRKDATGGDCDISELAEAGLNPQGDMANKCYPPYPTEDDQDNGSDGKPDPTKPKGDRIPGMFDPLILDLNHNGQIDTTDINTSGGSYFDIDGTDGGIRERMGWVGEGDGFLVQDKNGNGKIDGIVELFGNSTTNAFDDLRARIDSNGDGIIDSRVGLI